MTGSVGGSSSTTNSTSQTDAKKEPWGPTIGPLKDLIEQLSGQVDYKPTPFAQQTYNMMLDNQMTGNTHYFDAMQKQGNQMLWKGIPKSINQGYQQSYDQLNQRLSPYADGKHMGPDGMNPQLSGYLDTMRNDISNQTNGMFAAAGRDFSGAHFGNLARGIAEGEAPVLAQQYNTDVGRQFDAANTLAGAKNQLGQLQTGYAKDNAGMKSAGINMALGANDMRQDYMKDRLNAIYDWEQGRPIQHYGSIASILGPIAQLGGTVNSTTAGTSSTNGSSFGLGMGGK